MSAGKKWLEETLAEAKRSDSDDSLASFRDRFHFPTTPATARRRAPGSRSIYLCGNSLGLQPKRVETIVGEELTKWREHGVEGHFVEPNPWVTVDELGIEETAAVVGAKPIEVCNMNSLTVNLHFMMAAFYRPEGARYKIMIEGKAFPSDYHAVESQLRHHGYDPAEAMIQLRPRAGEETLRTEDIEATIDKHGSELALVRLGPVFPLFPRDSPVSFRSTVLCRGHPPEPLRRLPPTARLPPVEPLVPRRHLECASQQPQPLPILRSGSP